MPKQVYICTVHNGERDDDAEYVPFFVTSSRKNAEMACRVLENWCRECYRAGDRNRRFVRKKLPKLFRVPECFFRYDTICKAQARIYPVLMEESIEELNAEWKTELEAIRDDDE